MPSAVTQLLLGCFGGLVVLFVVDAIRSGRWGRFGVEMVGLLLAFLVLRWTLGFPDFGPNGQSFGPGDNPWPMIGLVFFCILLGMAARYFFYLKSAFSWSALLKPICVSPIVLLPLLGTLEDASQLRALQVVSFCILAFQNGFFWRVVFERAQANLEKQP